MQGCTLLNGIVGPKPTACQMLSKLLSEQQVARLCCANSGLPPGAGTGPVCTGVTPMHKARCSVPRVQGVCLGYCRAHSIGHICVLRPDDFRGARQGVPTQRSTSAHHHDWHVLCRAAGLDTGLDTRDTLHCQAAEASRCHLMRAAARETHLLSPSSDPGSARAGPA